MELFLTARKNPTSSTIPLKKISSLKSLTTSKGFNKQYITLASRKIWIYLQMVSLPKLGRKEARYLGDKGPALL